MEKLKNNIIRIAVKIVPESNGSPKVFTKKTSMYPNSPKVEGNKSLKIKSNIATERIFAIMKFLMFGFGYFLKK